MEVVQDVKESAQSFPSVVLTMGSFDGVHRGHQRVLAELLRQARSVGGTAAVLTMRPHPREFFAPDHAPNLLTSDVKKLELLERAGVDVVFFLTFDEATASMAPGEFVEAIIHGKCHAVQMVVGHDCRFGKDGAGDYEFLVEMGRRHGHKVTRVPAFIIDGERVSSTLIRERLLEGDLAQAEAFLGRKYSVVGEVIAGRGIGVELGFATANIVPHHTAVPAQGVYAAEVLMNGRRYPAAVNIGIAPTIRHQDTVVEAHLLDFDEDIRGRVIEIVFHKRLRPEKKFSSHQELSVAIRRDVQAVREYFS